MKAAYSLTYKKFAAFIKRYPSLQIVFHFECNMISVNQLTFFRASTEFPRSSVARSPDESSDEEMEMLVNMGDEYEMEVVEVVEEETSTVNSKPPKKTTTESSSSSPGGD